jgi:hypothetical protein
LQCAVIVINFFEAKVCEQRARSTKQIKVEWQSKG